MPCTDNAEYAIFFFHFLFHFLLLSFCYPLSSFLTTLLPLPLPLITFFFPYFCSLLSLCSSPFLNFPFSSLLSFFTFSFVYFLLSLSSLFFTFLSLHCSLSLYYAYDANNSLPLHLSFIARLFPVRLVLFPLLISHCLIDVLTNKDEDLSYSTMEYIMTTTKQLSFALLSLSLLSLP